ncbi:Ppx/GppA phosphatase family protein [Gardnerella vaginalis JCP8108]|uniref:Ppx/GppA phosphatase family protein n=2 Tax=Gardnerella vaginalis TaxID=2702 RepID=S4GU76_GARVA|nr:Ppx/GppA phosphatase family protein [Gardnerella vaginalis JCP8108]
MQMHRGVKNMDLNIQSLVDSLLENPASDADRDIVKRQLGRFPRGMVAVGARCACGRPLAVITRPCLEDGTPFPTTCYLTSPEAVKAASHLEAQGFMKECNNLLNNDNDVAKKYEQAHKYYLEFRHELAIRLEDSEEHIKDMSAGGMPVRVKCLHALLAQSLVMGKGVNPIGDMVLSKVKNEFDPNVCKCTTPWSDDANEIETEKLLNTKSLNTNTIVGTNKSVCVAAIDCGTNSIRLKIAKVNANGMRDVVPRMLRVVRLGQGIDETHMFAEDALQRVKSAAKEFAKVLSEHKIDAIRFVATSATRDALNRDIFEQMMFDELGVRPEVISGTEEAALSFLGATSVVSRKDLQAPYVVVDLGGGSTEIVLGGDGVNIAEDKVDSAYSMNIGSVRMTERHLHTDPPTEEEISCAIKDIDKNIDEAFKHVNAGKARTIIGVSGTVTTMAALAIGLKHYDHKAVDGVKIALDQAYTVNDRFLHMTRERRRTYATIHPGRIDVVGGGAVVLSRVLERLAKAAYEDHGGVLDTFVASEHGLLDGITLDLGRRILATR